MKDTIILIIAVLGHLVYLFAGIRVIEEVSGVSIIDKETSEEDLEWNKENERGQPYEREWLSGYTKEDLDRFTQTLAEIGEYPFLKEEEE